MHILITGATGFIGKSLVKELLQKNFKLTIALRKNSKLFANNINKIIVGDFNNVIDWSSILNDIDCIIHLASMVHLSDFNTKSVLDEINNVNIKSTLNLAIQASNLGVKRFIFISSIGVNGYQNNKSLSENDIPNPQGPYAISKCRAEKNLLNLAKNSNLEIVIIRPATVYGKDAPGNFGRLLNWVNARYPFPLPFGAINNSRSYLALDNLVNFILVCIKHEKASNEVFLLSDDNDLSTTQLLKNILKIHKKKTILLPVPVNLLFFLSKLLGKKNYGLRLFSSLRINNSKARKLLGWRPIVKMEDQLKP